MKAQVPLLLFLLVWIGGSHAQDTCLPSVTKVYSELAAQGWDVNDDGWSISPGMHGDDKDLPITWYSNFGNQNHPQTTVCTDVDCTDPDVLNWTMQTVGASRFIKRMLQPNGDGQIFAVDENYRWNILFCENPECRGTGTLWDTPDEFASVNDDNGSGRTAAYVAGDGVSAYISFLSAQGNHLFHRCIQTAQGSFTCAQQFVTSTPPVNDGPFDTDVELMDDGLPVVCGRHNNKLKITVCETSNCNTTLEHVPDGDTSGVEDGIRCVVTQGSDGFPTVAHLTNIGDVYVTHCTDAVCSSSTTAFVTGAVNNDGTGLDIARGEDGPVIALNKLVGLGNVQRAAALIVCFDDLCEVSNLLRLDEDTDLDHGMGIAINAPYFDSQLLIAYGTEEGKVAGAVIDLCAERGTPRNDPVVPLWVWASGGTGLIAVLVIAALINRRGTDKTPTVPGRSALSMAISDAGKGGLGVADEGIENQFRTDGGLTDGGLSDTLVVADLRTDATGLTSRGPGDMSAVELTEPYMSDITLNSEGFDESPPKQRVVMGGRAASPTRGARGRSNSPSKSVAFGNVKVEGGGRGPHRPSSPAKGAGRGRGGVLRTAPPPGTRKQSGTSGGRRPSGGSKRAAPGSGGSGRKGSGSGSRKGSGSGRKGSGGVGGSGRKGSGGLGGSGGSGRKASGGGKRPPAGGSGRKKSRGDGADQGGRRM